ncbi:LysR family transcriptional regulator ArgP [Acinetobacter tianfuensis]|uniref:LysR family transcriptional regulator ArgP n=1 Tax=Acinetobacter tianfuensis TaxID=2419603 RepID=A0A3A8E2T8_9GAMM|nr:LysR family transcriptional regulator ArgP [Acinetobacter tianfuensis]RKG29277.1 LysR family transcriptional regulator ArgP [Acinetobacter tianfuensis]
MLNHKQCEAFLAVAETGSFDAAAEHLHITASAVTLRIQSLEKNLGQMLLVRERPCRTTPAGLALMQHLQHSRLLEQQFIQNLQGQTDHAGFYQLNIATNDDSLATWLVPLLQQTVLEESICLHLQIDDQTQTHHLLEAGLVSACISTEEKAMKGCIAAPLGSMHYRMVCTPQFAQQWFPQGVYREALRKAPAVIYNRKDQFHGDILLKHFGLQQSSYPHHFIPSSHIFAQAICSSLGYGMLPDYQSMPYLKDGTLIEILPELRTDMHLYWHHWKQQSVQLQKLTQVLTQQAAIQMNQY